MILITSAENSNTTYSSEQMKGLIYQIQGRGGTIKIICRFLEFRWINGIAQKRKQPTNSIIVAVIDTKSI
jgi:hypothetical protein